MNFREWWLDVSNPFSGGMVLLIPPPGSPRDTAVEHGAWGEPATSSFISL